ncbi:MAG: hypothetical protein LBI95_02525 [Holosporales bacterium]|jgi:hypothetical protein|nr:hypothetical protein [Holosporales bacterium]
MKSNKLLFLAMLFTPLISNIHASDQNRNRPYDATYLGRSGFSRSNPFLDQGNQQLYPQRQGGNQGSAPTPNSPLAGVRGNPFLDQGNQQLYQQRQRGNQGNAPTPNSPLAEVRGNPFLDQGNQQFSQQRQGESQENAPTSNSPLAEQGVTRITYTFSNSEVSDCFNRYTRSGQNLHSLPEQNPTNSMSKYNFDGCRVKGCFNAYDNEYEGALGGNGNDENGDPDEN